MFRYHISSLGSFPPRLLLPCSVNDDEVCVLIATIAKTSVSNINLPNKCVQSASQLVDFIGKPKIHPRSTKSQCGRSLYIVEMRGWLRKEDVE